MQKLLGLRMALKLPWSEPSMRYIGKLRPEEVQSQMCLVNLNVWGKGVVKLGEVQRGETKRLGEESHLPEQTL